MVFDLLYIKKLFIYI